MKMCVTDRENMSLRRGLFKYGTNNVIVVSERGTQTDNEYGIDAWIKSIKASGIQPAMKFCTHSVSRMPMWNLFQQLIFVLSIIKGF